jgi:hypothetical protein
VGRGRPVHDPVPHTKHATSRAVSPPPKHLHHTPLAQPLRLRQVPAPAGAGRPAADQRLLPRAGAAQPRVRRLHRAARVRPALGGGVRRHARGRGLRARGSRGPHLAGAAPGLDSWGGSAIMQSWGVGALESRTATRPALRHVPPWACCKKTGTLVSTAIRSPAAPHTSTAARAGCAAQAPVFLKSVLQLPPCRGRSRVRRHTGRAGQDSDMRRSCRSLRPRSRRSWPRRRPTAPSSWRSSRTPTLRAWWAAGAPSWRACPRRARAAAPEHPVPDRGLIRGAVRLACTHPRMSADGATGQAARAVAGGTAPQASAGRQSTEMLGA